MTTTEGKNFSDNFEQEKTDIPTQEKSITSNEPKPESIENEAVKKKEFIDSIEIPAKFKNKDGTTNISSLLKSYKELEPLINEKANWTKEKNQLTQELSKLKKQEISDLDKESISLYEQFIEQSTDKEKAKNFINELKTTPTNERIKELEKLYPIETVKEILIQANDLQIKNKIELYKQTQDEEFKNIESYLKNVVEKNIEALKNPVTANIFNEVFLRFGSNFDTDWFFGKIEELKTSIILEYQKKQLFNEEKENAITTASRLSPKNNINKEASLLHRNALDLTPQELDKMLDEFYKK